VINAEQASWFLTAAGRLGPRGKRLRTFFGCMYYEALRPEEATDLRDTNIVACRTADGASSCSPAPTHVAARTGPTTAAFASVARSSIGQLERLAQYPFTPNW
jgi:hypothetical protein